MDDELPDVPLATEADIDPDEIVKLRDHFQSRLVAANLRTEAVRAGMVDLDGLRLIDISGVQLGSDDAVIGGRKMMDDLRRGFSALHRRRVPPSRRRRSRFGKRWHQR